jgi:hypothetical protein
VEEERKGKERKEEKSKKTERRGGRKMPISRFVYEMVYPELKAKRQTEIKSCKKVEMERRIKCNKKCPRRRER